VSAATASVPAPALKTTSTATGPHRPGGGGRDRYIDTLRVVALVRVVTYHTVGWAWLPLVFPSMGVMFALAGSLVAASLDRAPHGHYGVLRRRLRRLLLPLWAFGLVMVSVMLVHGWDSSGEGEAPSATLLLWLLPVGTPPADALAQDWVLPLWYVRSYLWFLLLSPALLWLFRRWPLRTLLVPPALVLAQELSLLDFPGRGGDAVLSFGIFGACWLLGFAHHDGVLRRLPLRRVLPAGLALMAVGAGVALAPGGGWDLDDLPLANTAYSLGFVLLLLRAYPDFSWMRRHRVLDGVVSAVNSRALTIYLWGNVAIAAATPLLDASPLAPWYRDDALGTALQLAAAWCVIGLCVLAVGWVEDLAARKRPRLLPWPSGVRVGRSGR